MATTRGDMTTDPYTRATSLDPTYNMFYNPTGVIPTTTGANPWSGLNSGQQYAIWQKMAYDPNIYKSGTTENNIFNQLYGTVAPGESLGEGNIFGPNFKSWQFGNDQSDNLLYEYSPFSGGMKDPSGNWSYIDPRSYGYSIDELNQMIDQNIAGTGMTRDQYLAAWDAKLGSPADAWWRSAGTTGTPTGGGTPTTNTPPPTGVTPTSTGVKDPGFYANGQFESNLGQQFQNLAPTYAQKFTDPSEYLDPSMQWRMKQGTDALEQSAAARGGLLSGATLKGIEDYAQNLASTEWGKAYDRGSSDRAFRYGVEAGDRQFGYNAALQDWINNYSVAKDDRNFDWASHVYDQNFNNSNLKWLAEMGMGGLNNQSGLYKALAAALGLNEQTIGQVQGAGTAGQSGYATDIINQIIKYISGEG